MSRPSLLAALRQIPRGIQRFLSRRQAARLFNQQWWRGDSLSSSTISMQGRVSPQLYPPPSLSPPNFEFTKRQRWADLLTAELTEAIILTFSTQCQILYCSVAVKELLGWRKT